MVWNDSSHDDEMELIRREFRLMRRWLWVAFAGCVCWIGVVTAVLMSSTPGR